MPYSYLGVHGVDGLVVAVGERGRVIHFEGDLYHPREVEVPTQATLRGVWVESASLAWAVGDGVLLEWNGRQWLSIAAPSCESFRAIWGNPAEGVWFGGQRHLVNYRLDGSGGTLITTDTPIRAIWGTSPDDIFFLSDERCLLHWDGQGCCGEALPGDDDEEWSAVAGSGPEAPVYIVGISGLAMEWDRRAWWEMSTDTPALLTAAVATGPEDLWVTTESGQVRHWNGQHWRTVAFSAFGALRALCFVDGVLWASGDRGVVLQHQPDDGGGKE